MRILVLSNMYPPHHLGGYELSCRDVMDRLRVRGHEVTVLTTTMRVNGVVDPPDERARGIRRDLTFYWDDHRPVSPSLRARLHRERANQQALRDALEASRPDVVSVWNMGAMSLGLITTLAEERIPMVFAICDDWLVYGPKLDAWMRLFRGPRLLARAARPAFGVPTALPDLTDAGGFCFVSDFVRRRAAEKARQHPRHSTVVYSGIDRADFPPHAPQPRPRTGTVLFVGRIDDRKGLAVAIQALRLFPDGATLEVIGRGDPVHRAHLDALAAELGMKDRVRFGVAPRNELHDHYEAADVVVFPVLWDEPFGLVPIEAMACGTPVVATATGGSAEFLAHELTCLVVPPGDAEALAAAVTRLNDDADLRARLVENGLRLADELTTDRLADVFDEWHIATAEGFSHGQPADRPSPLSVISERGTGEAVRGASS
jgi:glycogen synthase